MAPGVDYGLVNPFHQLRACHVCRLEIAMSKRQRFKIYRDQVKERHTSHWDWDYLSRSELNTMLYEETGDKVVSRRKESLFTEIVRWLLRRS